MDGLAAYKANSANNNHKRATKYPAPKVPTFNRPVPQKRPENSLEKAKNASSQKCPENAKTKNVHKEKEKKDSKKPELKEKPTQFTTFKQQTSSSKPTTKSSSNSSPGTRRRLSKVASESDLVKTLEQEGVGSSNLFITEENEPVSITISQNEDSPAEDQASPIRRSSYYIRDIGQDHQVNNKLIIDTSKTFKTQRSVSTDSLLSEPKLRQSEPLLITTEPLNDLHHKEEEEEEDLDDNERILDMDGLDSKSCSTSFESTTDDSLLSTSKIGGLNSSSNLGDSGGDSSCCDVTTMTRTKSPSTSTTSRSPPSPLPMGLSPVRQVRLSLSLLLILKIPVRNLGVMLESCTNSICKVLELFFAPRLGNLSQFSYVTEVKQF